MFPFVFKHSFRSSLLKYISSGHEISAFWGLSGGTLNEVGIKELITILQVEVQMGMKAFKQERT